MDKSTGNAGLSDALATEIPYLRRYARALTGSQEGGDRYAAATLEAIVADPKIVDRGRSTKIELFRCFHEIWTSSGALVEDPEFSERLLEQRAQWRLAGLSANSREALLLNAIEGFAVPGVAQILSISNSEAEELIDRAREEMGRMVKGDVLIIEDEAIIAMDLHAIVESMGHNVTDIARTRDGAVRLGEATRPDLILADIQLADKSSGIDAVNDLLRTLGDVPVIFITAFPERLLTGERPEPAFLITKPYSEEQVRAAVSQAMFFASTEGLLQAG
ncbi:response regulator [Roseibacterium sp. SDUM158017]|uniref:response regulator n=1 Tax=Roseicyclus salinarum TaxID=3036773 RepID=UPI0024158601|nr:response regulator [Roseibacterium sp. SDUM158017]MDG4647801.1 response regulator [Roseibacterium sp. SDUM158017]